MRDFWCSGCPSFPCCFGKRQGKPPKKQGFFIPTEPLKSLQKKGKNAQKNKEILARKKKQGIPQKKLGKEGQGSDLSLPRLLDHMGAEDGPSCSEEEKGCKASEVSIYYT